MPRAVEHPVETHRRVPIQEVHNFRQIFLCSWFYQIMDAVRHNAQGLKFEAVFVQSLLDSIQKDFATFPPR